METARLLAARDPEGLRRLLADHGGRVRWMLRSDFKDVLDEFEIEDALSKASQRVWRSSERLDLSRGTLRAWFCAIARNCALRVLEAKQAAGAMVYVANLDEVAPNAAAPDGLANPARAEFVEDLYRCIDGLSAQQRAVILADLRAGGVAATEDLVRQLNTTRNTIYVARATGRKSLRAALIARGHTIGIHPAPIHPAPLVPKVTP